MLTESTGVNHDLLAAYVDEAIDGIYGAERNEKLSAIRIELARDLDGGDWSETDKAVTRSFLAEFDRNYPLSPENEAPAQPVNSSKAIRRGLLSTLPRIVMVSSALMGAARTGGARHLVVAGMVILFILLGRAAYMSIRAGQA